MTHFMSSHAAGNDWRSACLAAVEKLGRLGSQFTLGFFYVNDPIGGDLVEIYNALRLSTGLCDWVGAVGYGVCGLAMGDDVTSQPGILASSSDKRVNRMVAGEYFDQPAVTLLATDMPREDFRVFSIASGDLSDFRAQHGAWIAEAHPRLAIVHGDSRNPRTQDLISRLSEETGAFLVGGMASFTSVRNQIAGGIASSGLSGVMFASRVAVISGLSQGSAPLGPVHRITNADGNILITLDGRPALDVLREDVGIESDVQLRRLASYVNIALLVPHSDVGDYIARNLVGIDSVRGLVAASDNIEPGGRIMFCARDSVTATADLRSMVGNLAKRAAPTVTGALYFSCVARGPNLFGPNAEEVKLLRDGLPGVPLAGFYANGEISNNRLYGYTGVLVAFR
jgi:small ligand-binding sensory domain FIST